MSKSGEFTFRRALAEDIKDVLSMIQVEFYKIPILIPI